MTPVLYIEPVPINTVFRWFPENSNQTILAGKSPFQEEESLSRIWEDPPAAFTHKKDDS